MLISKADRDLLFTVSDTSRCPIENYTLTNTADANITSSNEEYTYLNLANWTTFDDIVVKTDFTSTSGEKERTFKFKFGAYTRGKAQFSQ